MASLLKRGGIWSARIHLDGKDRWRSMGTADRVQAERKARDLEAAYKGRDWVRRQFTALIDRARAEVQPDEASLLCETVTQALSELILLVPTEERDQLALALSRRLVEQQGRKLSIADGWNAWHASANRSAPKDRTLRGYRAMWAKLAEWSKGHGLQWMHEVGEAEVLAYADYLWSTKLSPQTFNAHARFLRGAWNCLRVAAGLTSPNPWGCIKSKTSPADTGRRDLTPAELRTLIASAQGSLRLLLLAGALTGSRLGDIVTMRWSDLDLETGEWTFTPMKTSRTGKRLALPLLEPLLSELRAVKSESIHPDVFQRERELWARGDLTEVISAHFEACGIVTQEAVADGSQRRRARIVAGFHSLRHSAATISAKSGQNLALIQSTLGHGSAGMTARYCHGDSASARQVLGPLAEVLALPAESQVAVRAIAYPQERVRRVTPGH